MNYSRQFAGLGSVIPARPPGEQRTRAPNALSATRARPIAPNWLSRALLALFGLLEMCGPCRADLGLCTGGADSVAFGTLPLSSLQNATAVGEVIAGCPPGLGLAVTWDYCASIGAGTNSVSQTDRRMTSGSNYISYQLYTNSGYSNPYQYLGTNMVALTYNPTINNFDIQYVYGKILSTGALVPPGTYSDSYSAGTQSSISIDALASGNPAVECTGATGTHAWVTTAFTVSVTLSPSCSVTAAALNFGTVGVLSANVDASTAISVACTYTTPYQVQLSAGGAPGATTASRAMTLGAAEVFYALYQDYGRSTNWGSNLGVDTVSGTGTGSAQSIPIYGRVPPQTTPAIGNYSDTIVVTVNY